MSLENFRCKAIVERLNKNTKKRRDETFTKCDLVHLSMGLGDHWERTTTFEERKVADFFASSHHGGKTF